MGPVKIPSSIEVEARSLSRRSNRNALVATLGKPEEKLLMLLVFTRDLATVEQAKSKDYHAIIMMIIRHVSSNFDETR